jgi:hypothetical protein
MDREKNRGNLKEESTRIKERIKEKRQQKEILL